jgi:hypothetical protein
MRAARVSLLPGFSPYNVGMKPANEDERQAPGGKLVAQR